MALYCQTAQSEYQPLPTTFPRLSSTRTSGFSSLYCRFIVIKPLDQALSGRCSPSAVRRGRWGPEGGGPPKCWEESQSRSSESGPGTPSASASLKQTKKTRGEIGELRTRAPAGQKAVARGSHPVEVVEDVGGVSGPKARRGHADDGHAVRDLHLLLHPRQVVGLALRPGGHVGELHRSVIQPLVGSRERSIIQTTTVPGRKQEPGKKIIIMQI